MMKKYTLLFLFMVLGVSARVYGQEQTKRVIPKNVSWFNQYIPIHDTVIMRGEEIEVGAYFARRDKDKYEEAIEVEGFGRSKKSDVDKGYFVVKLKPQNTTRYNISIKNYHENAPTNFNKTQDRRIVYVAKTEEERKKLQEDIDSKRKALREQIKKGGARLDKFDVR